MKIKKIILIIFLGCAMNLNNAYAEPSLKKAIFAGGCFWCMESPFEKIDGVKDVVAGYVGGRTINPTYEEVSSGMTGHREAVEVLYDPSKVSYATLLDIFWQNIDPTDANGQFVDKGPQYRTAIFYQTEEEKRLAEQSKERLAKSGRFDKPIVTQILKATKFYKAEDYHQDYYEKQPARYSSYRAHSGRDQFLEEAWGGCPLPGLSSSQPGGLTAQPSKEALKKQLPAMQYRVTQENGTEAPFQNEYWDNKKEGIYVDVVSGEVLFSSLDKFDSGTGWPSFTKPLESGNVIEKEDTSLSAARTEVRSKTADSHLGHVFDDGPQPTGQRYCINSAALRFIPKEDLEREGYGQYKKLFEK